MNVEVSSFSVSNMPISSIDVNGNSMAIYYLSNDGNCRVEIWSLERNVKETVIDDKISLSNPSKLAFLKNNELVYIKSRNEVVISDLDAKPISILNCKDASHLSVNTDGFLAISGETVSLWDLRTNKRKWTFDSYVAGKVPDTSKLARIHDIPQVPLMPASILFTISSRQLYILGTMDYHFYSVELDDFKTSKTKLDYPFQVLKSKISSDNQYLFLTGAFPQGNFLFDLKNKRRILDKYFKENQYPLTAFSFDHSGAFLVTGGLQGKILVQSIPEGKYISSFSVGYCTVTDIVFSGDNRKFYCSVDEGKIYCFDFEDFIRK